MKRKEKGHHYAETKKINVHHYIFFFFILIFILIGIYFTFMINGILNINIKEEDNIKNNFSNINLSLSESHVIENSNILTSKNLLITDNNGLSTISGTIENASENELTDLNFVYTLYDDLNNIFYEFEIYVSDLVGYNSTSFSSICLKDLSNITKYSVSLIP